ncbi:MAG: Mur ligase family protein [bacterium]|nr:Mur ligase family protein [bacterium]
MIRSISKKAVQFILKWQAKAYIRIKRPYIIIVAGTTSRLWVKEKVVEALKNKSLSARSNKKNFNAEIGLPLSILGLESGEGDFQKWREVIFQGFKKILNRDSGKHLVLEAAIDHPEDMKYLLGIVRPNAVILTTITMIYQENFDDLDDIQVEYKTLVEALPQDGVLILNNDDERVRVLSRGYKGKVISYGIDRPSDLNALDIKKVVDGQEFQIVEKHEKYQRKISRFGRHHVMAELVKVAVEREL